MKSNWKAALACMTLALGAQGPAAAQEKAPVFDKPIRILVGFAAGGANDMLARLIGQRMSESLGVSVVVENRPGAAGVIATEAVVRSAPDGHTLLLGSIGTQSFVPILQKDTLRYDSRRDLQPISLVGNAGMVLTVRNDFPARTVEELIALAKASPGKYTYASGGQGNSLHVATELFRHMSGVEMLHVPYKGNAPALNAVASGEVDMMFSAVPPVLSLAQTGKVRLLAVTSKQRLHGLDQVPTLNEAGVPGYEVSSWYGLFGPRGIPADRARFLAEKVAEALAVPAVREQILPQGIEPAANTPEEFERFVNAEIDKWGELFKTIGLSVQ